MYEKCICICECLHTQTYAKCAKSEAEVKNLFAKCAISGIRPCPKAQSQAFAPLPTPLCFNFLYAYFSTYSLCFGSASCAKYLLLLSLVIAAFALAHLPTLISCYCFFWHSTFLTHTPNIWHIHMHKKTPKHTYVIFCQPKIAAQAFLDDLPKFTFASSFPFQHSYSAQSGCEELRHFLFGTLFFSYSLHFSASTATLT